MKTFFKRNWAFLALTLCALIAAGGILLGRAQAEAQYETYDVVVDIKDFTLMAAQGQTPIDEYLAIMRDCGIQRVALFEDTILSLSGSHTGGLTYAKVSTIQGQGNWRVAYPEKVVGWISDSIDIYDILVEVEDEALFTWITDALERRAPDLNWDTCAGDGIWYLWIDGCYKMKAYDWLSLPLGLLPETVEKLESYGFTVVPRTGTLAGCNTVEYARDVLEGFRKLDTPYFMPSGNGLLGWEDAEESRQLLLDYLNDTGVAMVVTEEMDQSQNVTWSGFDALVMDELDSQVIRAFNEYGFIQNRWQYYGYPGSEEIVNSLFRAAVERNCRVIYLKAIMDTDSEEDYITDPAAYEELFNGIFERMATTNLTYGRANALPAYCRSTLWRLVLGLGLVGGALLLLELMIRLPMKWRLILAALGVLAVGGAFYCAPNGVKLLLSMGAAVLFPCLAGLGLYRIIQADRWKGTPGFGGLLARCLGAVVFCGAFVLVGALVATSALSESSYMVEMQLYRGVKLMQLVPIAFLAGMFLLIFTVEDLGLRPAALRCAKGWIESRGSADWRRSRKAARKEILDRTIQVRHAAICAGLLLVAAAVAAAGIYYLMRTGNTSASMDVPQLELKMRNLLENKLIARPRTKEFLIGWPCVMLLVYALHHRSRVFSFLFALGAAIGLTSVVNTFQHIRTPLGLSLLRTGYGLLLGAVIGTAAVVVLELLRRLAAHWRLPDA